jgi:hypothetical protein
METIQVQHEVLNLILLIFLQKMNENERKSYIEEIVKMVCPKTEGTKQVILIGFNYYGKRMDRLIGCAYDAIRMKDC